jgi:diacylglycerol kinase family enzyme
MHVVLVYNTDAGAGDVDADAAARAIQAAGHAVRAASCRDPACEALLEQPADVIVVCGGDGTVGRVAKAMAGRGLPLVAVAAGTANNIALTLEVLDSSLEDQLRSLHLARRVRFDVAEAHGPWGSERLIEGLGCGLFASSIEAADRSMEASPPEEAGHRLARSLQILKERVAAFPAMRIQATLDGQDISGDYVVFEAMNTRFIGPNLFLAPDADPGDGQLDVVLVGEDERAVLKDHLASWQRGALQPPPLRSIRGRELRMQWTGFDLHLDDTLWPPPDSKAAFAAPAGITVSIGPEGVEFLVPTPG